MLLLAPEKLFQKSFTLTISADEVTKRTKGMSGRNSLFSDLGFFL